MSPLSKYKVASVQAAPIFFDAAATVAKTVELIKEAAANGASLVVFPELWIPGYPYYIWLYAYAHQVKFIPQYYANSLAVGGPEQKILEQACRDNKIMATIGVSEKDHGSLYMAQWTINAQGETVSQRRKLKPSIAERLVFGEGDGSDIRVLDTPLGRMGALMCWEHVQPILTHTMGMMHEQIHCASWPSFSIIAPHHSLSAVANYAANITYAVSTSTFLIMSSAVLSKQNVDVLVDGDESLRSIITEGGGCTMILDPEGREMVEKPDGSLETIVYAEVDLSLCEVARSAMDPSGHYGRSDVFQLQFDNTPRQGIHVGSNTSRSTSATASRRMLRAELFPSELPSSPSPDSDRSYIVL